MERRQDGRIREGSLAFDPRRCERPQPDFAYAYITGGETTIYHLLAARYALADENFAPRLVPTFPSHYTLGDRAEPHRRQSERRHLGLRRKARHDGSDLRRRRDDVTPGIFPCFDQPTIGDLLDAGHVSWNYYTGRIDALSNQAVNVYDAFRNIRYGSDWHRNVVTPPGRFLSDIAELPLPQVSFVMPTGGRFGSCRDAERLAARDGSARSIWPSCRCAHSYAACDYYKDTAMILTWDDSGGWYDHVTPPPGPNGTTWGFRIPIVVMSPWARSNYDPAHPGTRSRSCRTAAASPRRSRSSSK